MTKSKKNLMYPVEYLIFKVEDASKVDEFINLDSEIWTKYLAEKKGFKSKEMWINVNNPGEIHSIIRWKSLEDWKSIPVEELKEIDALFKVHFPTSFEIVGRKHKEFDHKFFLYDEYEQYEEWEQ